MAKRKYQNRGNNRGGGTAAKSKHTGAKIIAGLAILLAVAYVITSLALGMVWNPLKWFKKTDGTSTMPTRIEYGENLFIYNNTVCSESGIALPESETYTLPKLMTIVQDNTQKLSTLTLRATVYPSNADDKRLIWTSSNPEAVRIEISETDSTIITVSNYTEFSEPVTITCRSVDNREVSAYCLVDCLVIPDNTDLLSRVLDKNTAVDKIQLGKEYFVNTSSKSVGTVSGYFTTDYLTIGLTEEMQTALKNELNVSSFNNFGEYIFESDSFELNISPHYFVDASDGEDGITYAAFDSAFKRLIKLGTVNSVFNIIVTGNFMYDGGKGSIKMSEYSSLFTIGCDVSNIWVGVDDVIIGSPDGPLTA